MSSRSLLQLDHHDMDSQLDDPRFTELETLEAIYPEIRRPDDIKDPFTFEIDLPVHPSEPVTVTFPAAVGNEPIIAAGGQGPHPSDDSLQVTHLPALKVRISLPHGYPSDHPPQIIISTDPQWLPQETVSKLESEGPKLWEDMGHDMVVFTYIDHVQRAADDVFGSITPEGTLHIAPQYKLAVLDYDIKAKKEAFERETFDCGICLDPKKGSKCHKMLACGHIFCLQCLKDFYEDAIDEGNIGTVRCLTPNCAKERSNAQKEDGKKEKKQKTAISPSELLQIGLSESTVQRFVTLKYKTQLESDKNTIYCPRQWCSGAARSKKHKKPSGLDFVEVSDHDSDSEDEEQKDPDKASSEKKKTKPFDPADLLAICEDCNFAFCSRCLQTWHGEFFRCTPKREKEELTEEEKASLEYLKLHTSPCPTCNAPAQKTHGCNHMICSRCDTHFCYLCSAWLDPSNPYQHYNTAPGGKVTSCYMRLWELEGGDGDDVGLGFGGGNHVANRPAPVAAVRDDAVEAVRVREEPRNRPAARPNQQLDENGRPIAVDREAPLVLRLFDNQPDNAQPVAAPEPAHPPIAQGAHRANRGRQPRGGAAALGQRGQHQQGRAARAREGPPRAPAAGRGRGFNRGARGGVQPQPNVGRGAGIAIGGGGGEAGLDAAQEAWVRQFVQMALMDVEDEIDDDLDDDELFRIQ